MTPRKNVNSSQGQQHTQSHRWMVSYLDVLTILLLLFVTAAAASLKKVPPPAGTGKSESASVTVPDSPRDREVPQQKEEPQKKDALQEIERKLEEKGLDVHQLTESSSNDGQGLAIDLPQSVVFAPGDDRVRAEALPELRTIAGVLQDFPNKVNLAGHADATPIHNRRFKNNWELAAARSLRLMEVLTERYGLDPSRVSISSYGALEPKSPNNTPGGRATNRRVEIMIYAGR